MEAPVPSQVADRLRGRAFANFDDFRRAFWKAAATVPELGGQFSSANRALMNRGEAPKAPPSQQTAESTIFHLIHVGEGEGPYDVDAMRVVSPLRHHQIRQYGGVPLERGTWTIGSKELRDKIFDAVRRLMTPRNLDMNEMDRLVVAFEDNVLYPYASDLIFHWPHEFKDASELVDFALGQEPAKKLSRPELLIVARRLMTADVANAVQSERLSMQFKANVPHPDGDGLIFYPKVAWATPEELLDKALANKR
jgi:hypothetical protein